MFNVIRDVDNRDMGIVDQWQTARIEALRRRVKELEQQNQVLQERNQVLVVTLAEVNLGRLIDLHMGGILP